MKRLLDVLLGGMGLMLSLPVMGIVAWLIWRQGDGPVLFRQTRVGRNFKPFTLLKFRSMRVVSNPALQITASNDPRITPLGRLLRKTKLDELPQLWNVLRGDMSLVGPRPEVEKYVAHFREAYAEILRVRPGITDPVSLFYLNEEALLKAQSDPEAYYLEVLLPKKIALTQAYLAQTNSWRDMGILWKTFTKLLYR